MIVFDLACDAGHVFEGWFGSSTDFDQQRERGFVACPQCGSQSVAKAPMAPAVPRKGSQMPKRRAGTEEPSEHNPEGTSPAIGADPQEAHLLTRGALPPEVTQALTRLAEAQAKALRKSRWVGSKFAEQSRAMHYGERKTEAIHGQATQEEAESLLDEGIAVAPLPFPVAPPEDIN